MTEEERQRATPRRPYVVKDGAAQAARARGILVLVVSIARHPWTVKAGALVAVAVLTAIGTQVDTWKKQRQIVLQNEQIEFQANQAKLKAIATEKRVDDTIKVSTNPLVDEVADLRKQVEALKAASAATQKLLLSFVVTGTPAPAKRQLVRVVAANAARASQDLKARAAKKAAPLARKVPETATDAAPKPPAKPVTGTPAPAIVPIPPADGSTKS